MLCDLLIDCVVRCDSLVKIHGRYCGPNWTAGKKIAAEDATQKDFQVRSIDLLDGGCKIHDMDINRDGPSRESDLRLARVAQKVLDDSKSSKKLKQKARIVRDGMLAISLIRLK